MERMPEFNKLFRTVAFALSITEDHIPLIMEDE